MWHFLCIVICCFIHHLHGKLCAYFFTSVAAPWGDWAHLQTLWQVSKFTQQAGVWEQPRPAMCFLSLQLTTSSSTPEALFWAPAPELPIG